MINANFLRGASFGPPSPEMGSLRILPTMEMDAVQDLCQVMGCYKGSYCSLHLGCV
jgi:hypothetical protein